MDPSTNSSYTVSPVRSRRILIACDRCKQRKVRCDGGKPSCSPCAVLGAVDCIYSAIRKYRGPSKRPNHIVQQEGIQTPTAEPINSVAECSSSQGFRFQPGIMTPPASVDSKLDTRQRVDIYFDNLGSYTQPFNDKEAPNRGQSDPQEPLMPSSQASTFLNVLHHGDISNSLELYAITISIAKAEDPRAIAPLPLQFISEYLAQNFFDDVLSHHPILCGSQFNLEDFKRLLRAQYAANNAFPAGDSARWAIVNIVLALLVHFKMAVLSSDTDIGHVAEALYRNARMVDDELMQSSTPGIFLPIAFALMATFATIIGDWHDSRRLSLNAQNRLEACDLKTSSSVVWSDWKASALGLGFFA